MMQNIANIVMYVLVITIAVSVFRMRNRVYMVQKPKEPVGSDYGAPIGEVFPKTEFTTIDGVPISLIDTRKYTVVFITSPSCDVCKTLYPLITPFINKFGDEYQVVSLMFGDRKEIESLQNTIQLINPIIQISSEDLKEIKTERFPFGYILSSDGKVTSRGLVWDQKSLEMLRTWKPRNPKKRRLAFYRESTSSQVSG